MNLHWIRETDPQDKSFQDGFVTSSYLIAMYPEPKPQILSTTTRTQPGN